mgnify:CR=1 FL=1
MIKLKPFRQTPGLCGPASLKIVMDYYGVFKSEADIAKAAGATKEKGVSARGLAKAARHFGFKAVAKEKSSLGDVRGYIKRGIPVIVDWFSEDDGHYSVVADMDGKSIVLMDPELAGERTMSQEKFLRVWFDFPSKSLKTKKDVILRLMLAVQPFKK